MVSDSAMVENNSFAIAKNDAQPTLTGQIQVLGSKTSQDATPDKKEPLLLDANDQKNSKEDPRASGAQFFDS